MIETVQSSNHNFKTKIKFNPEKHGFVVCHVKNDDGHSEAMANVLVNDLDDGLIVWSSILGQVTANTNVSIACGASIHLYSELNWYKNAVLVGNSTGCNHFQLILAHL